MNNENIYKLEKAVEFLNNCYVSNSQILICGSFALEYHGLNIGREPHDVDVCITHNEVAESIIKGICDAQYNTFYKMPENSYNVSGCKHKPYIFTIDGGKISINVWVVEEFDSKLRVEEGPISPLTGCYVQPVSKILAAKKSYNRKKDWEDIGYIAGDIIKK